MSEAKPINIYLDHAATTPVRPEVIEAMTPYHAEIFGNPSSLHMAGQRARKALEEAREIIAHCIGAHDEEIHFTSGGTESDNMALRGVAMLSRLKGGHLITTSVEHQAVLSCARALEKDGFTTTFLPVDRQGVIDPGTLRDALQSDTTLVSVMLGNNETGSIQPIEDAAAITKERGIAFHTDAVQAVGKMPLDMERLGVDLLSLSAHKIGGPKGVGALYIRRGTRLAPLMHGGHQERELRPGTQNLPGIIGFAKALALATDELPRVPSRLSGLRDQLESAMIERVPGIHRNGSATQRLPHILNVSFENVEGEALLLALDLRGICVSTGSACTSGAATSSHVLQAMGVPPDLARGSLRFSVGRETTPEQMDTVATVVVETIAQLRNMSSFSDRS